MKASDNQTVTVADNEAPTITAPSDKTANTNDDGTGNCTTTVDLGSPTTSDNCGIQGTKAYVNGNVINPSTYDFPIGTTTVTWEVTDNAGLKASDNQTVTVADNEAPTITAPSDKTANANDDGTGNWPATVDLGSPTTSDNCGIQGTKAYVNGNVINPSTYDFPIGTTTATWEVTDNAGLKATDTQTVTISDNEAPTITAPAAVTVNSDSGKCTATISVANATANDNCGVGIPVGTRDDGLALDAPYPVGTTTITWEVSDNNGNAATPVEQKITIKDNEAPVPPTLSDIIWGCEYIVDVPVATDNCGNEYSGVANRSTTFSSTGTITWTFTDDAGNSSTATQKITISPVTATTDKVDVLCHGAETGEIHVTASGGIEPYTYTWNSLGNGPDHTGLTAGIYTFTVADANGCSTDPISVTVTETEQLAMSTPEIIPVTCNGANNGQVKAGTVTGGVPGYLYKITDITSGKEWNYQSSNKFTDLPPHDYTLTVQDDHACTISENFSITEPNELEMTTPSVTDVTCNGGDDGTLWAGEMTGGTPPYNYSIDNSSFGTSNEFTGLIAGSYTIFVQDANGCALQKTATVNEPDVLSTEIQKKNVTCNGAQDGEISVKNLSGGSGSYEFSIDGNNWTSGSEKLENLSPGTYQVQLRDANKPGCIVPQGEVTITEPEVLQATVTTTRTSTYGSATGSATANPTGGTPGYTYEWTKEGDPNFLQKTKTASNLLAGNYTVKIIDQNGCPVEKKATVIDKVTGEIIALSICENADGGIRTSTFSVDYPTILGGVGDPANFDYTWDFGADVESITTEGDSYVVHYSDTGDKIITLTIVDEPMSLPPLLLPTT